MRERVATTTPTRAISDLEHRKHILERALAAEPHGNRARMNAAELAHLDEVADYLNSAAAVVGVDLVELERPPEVRETMLRETARAGVHRFENSADTGDASGNASGDAA